MVGAVIVAVRRLFLISYEIFPSEGLGSQRLKRG